MEDSYRSVIEQQNKKYIESAQLKGIVNHIYYDAWCADVQLIGNSTNVLRKVPISLALGKTDILVGDKCKIDVFDINNLDDCVIAYTYGRSRIKKANSGTITLSPSVLSVAHGLGQTPDIVVLNTPEADVPNFYLDSWDSNLIYFGKNGSPGTMAGYKWFAAIIE